MNSLAIKKVVYNFQDLVTQKKVKTFAKFYDEFNLYFRSPGGAYVTLKFIYKELKNIHAFLKIIQYHPNSYLLTQALKPLFEFLLNNLIVPKIVYVADRKFFHIYKIKYKDLIEASRGKRMFQFEGDMFVIPYSGKVPENQRKKRGLRLQHKHWVVDIVSQKIMGKLYWSQLRWGAEIFNPALHSDEQSVEFGHRLAVDYFNSDSECLPREIFEFEE